MRGITGWLEQWQVPLYLVAIALGAGFGLLLPAVAEPAEHAVTPVLGLLLYATFLGVPFARLGRALRDWRFLLTVVPLAAAALTQLAAARSRVGAWLRDAVVAAMVPLMVLTLFVVVASQLTGVGQRVRDLLGVVPVFLAFAAVMLGAGLIAGRVARLDVPSRRAIVFSGVTRNSLVVLPLVLALPAAYDLAPLVVVTQTLVELLIMVVFIRLVPALLPATVRANSTPSLGISGRASGN